MDNKGKELKTILITGATGLVGSALVNHLLQKKYSIHYLTTSRDKIKNTPNHKGFYWNLNENYIDKECLNGVETIVHLAGTSINKRWTKAYKKEIIDSRVQSAAVLYQLLKTTPNSVKHFISASGTAIYPERYDYSYAENDTQHDHRFLAQVVQLWEQAANQFSQLDITVSKVRTGVVFANKNSALQEIIKPIKYGFGAALGTGNQLLSWIHLSDLIQIYTLIIENNLSGVVNAVSPNAITNKQLTQNIAQKLKKPLLLPNIPKFMLKMLLGERSILVLKSENIQPKKLQELPYHFEFATINQALDDLL